MAAQTKGGSREAGGGGHGCADKINGSHGPKRKLRGLGDCQRAVLSVAGEREAERGPHPIPLTALICSHFTPNAPSGSPHQNCSPFMGALLDWKRLRIERVLALTHWALDGQQGCRVPYAPRGENG